VPYTTLCCVVLCCVVLLRYAPALRKLRKTALVFRFERPSTDRLASRLADICAQEGLTVDMQTLTALCEHADNDIRSCLNTLQVCRTETVWLDIVVILTLHLALSLSLCVWVQIDARVVWCVVYST
jgi:DNA polymerase III delta prime subunit